MGFESSTRVLESSVALRQRSELILWSGGDWGLVVCEVIIRWESTESAARAVSVESRLCVWRANRVHLVFYEYKINPVHTLQKCWFHWICFYVYVYRTRVFTLMSVVETYLMCPTFCIRSGREVNGVWFCIRLHSRLTVHDVRVTWTYCSVW